MTEDQLKKGSYYNIGTTAPAVMSARFTKVKLTGDFIYQSAIKQDSTLYATFAAVLPTIMANFPDRVISDDPSNYNWYSFSKTDGTEFILCSLWINDIELIESLKINVTITDGTVSDIAAINDFLSGVLGKQIFTITSL